MATTEMIGAIQSGHLTTVKQLFHPKGREENSPQDNKLLYYSARYGEYKVTEYFLMQGCDPNKTEDNTTLPLQEAVMYSAFGKDTLCYGEISYNKHGKNSLKICQLLVESGALLDQTASDGQTSLHSAAANGTPEIVEYFLKKGAYPNCTDKAGDIPLLAVMRRRVSNYRGILAINNASKEIIKLLLENGADPSLANKQGDTFESYLTQHEECMKRLQKHYQEEIKTVTEIRQWYAENPVRSNQRLSM